MFNSNTQIRYSPGSFFQKLAKNGAWKTTYCPKMGPGNLIQTSGSSRWKRNLQPGFLGQQPAKQFELLHQVVLQR